MSKHILLFFQLYMSFASYLASSQYEIIVGDAAQNSCFLSDCVVLPNITSAINFATANNNSTRQNFLILITNSSQDNSIINKTIFLSNFTLNFR